MDEEELIHSMVIMSLTGSLEWTILCTETLPEEGQKAVGISYLEKVTCKSCREKSEARIKRVEEKYMTTIMEIPWVKESIKDGVFDEE